jgi:hypothetical protein
MNNEMVKLLLVDCCRGIPLNIYQKKIHKVVKRFSYTDFVIAIIAKARTNKTVAQSLFSVIRGCSTCSIIGIQSNFLYQSFLL